MRGTIMPCYYNGHFESYCGYSRDKKDIKKLNAYLDIKNILNFKYCSFAIVDKEKDILEKIKKIIKEVEDVNNQR